ncbi:ATP-dependent helicase [Pseudaestuariivita atlantica]|uniref:DNA 3'-5' helicase n=1 Tax=Pseudaestuariivita atlantica TaxID=1317121 RepID=A0A0L1JUP2_9RHOB|nr:UvrD-helicase domain-containing protein [Pseudaestuariivita atlantica]KNG95128.1 DNA helicase II [Pseudaestuariivita atlantica]
MSSYHEDDAFEAAAASPGLAARAMAARGAPYLDGLNAEQRQAVEQINGPVLMLAGAGTGKTRALTTRIAHLLHTGTAHPNEILAVTFTNKAAREMKDRVGAMMGHAVEGMPWLGTFHAICVKLLRRHAELVGLKSNFTILDTDDQIRLLKQLLQASNIDDKRWPARALSSLIDGWKNRALTPDKVPAADASAFDHKGVQLYAQYQERLKELNATDFGDLLLHVLTIFQEHDDVLAQYQRWFRYILVDEYQDTNVAQYLWLRLLAQSHKNICCVGDDDQSIYGWRGAEVGNILRFEKDFPGARVIRLEQNYRSTQHILSAASGVIAANKGRLGKELWTEAEGGEKVRLIGHWDGEEEARWIGEEVEAMQRGTRGMDPMSLDDMAILVRASHQMRAFEDRFLTIGLPYRVIGGPRFYERMEIRDAMAYFRVVVSPEDDLAFERIVNTPKRGLGDKAQQKIQFTARQHGVSLTEGAQILLDEKGLGGKGAKELQTLLDGLQRWGRMAGDGKITHMELAEIILDESGYTTMWQNDKTPEAPGRLENLKELVKALEGFENLTGFLEHVSLVMDNEQGGDGEKVSIMTLHAAKGLEFPAVFLPGWEDGLFPSQRSMDENGVKGLEEERRLAYVGITRAERVCTISFAGNRRVFGQWQSALPSRFIDELPEEHVEVLTPPGLYGGGYGAAAPQSNLHEAASRADVYNSPGWRRLQQRSSQRPVSQPQESRNTVIDLTASSSHTVGERVFHQKFGYGTITGIEGDKLDIAFEKAGDKKVVAKFVMPADEIPF